jgi:prohibitin 1
MSPRIIGAVVVALLLLVFGGRFVKTVPAGHVAVATLFGSVRPEPLGEGFHLVNPLYSWTEFDTRQKTHKETASVPTQDQLQTEVDLSVQYFIVGDMAPRVLQETGTAGDAIEVHLVPKLRSLVREQGKTIPRAEDFFLEATQNQLQVALEGGLRDYLGPKGIQVQAVLIRDITLPPFITKAIEAKKEREQAVERQKAELARFRTEQEQKVAAAEAERAAAEKAAEKVKILADARAYEIDRVNRAVANNGAFIQLQALEALKAMSKDPAAKIYFMNGDASSPLPLLHMGDELKR